MTRLFDELLVDGDVGVVPAAGTVVRRDGGHRDRQRRTSRLRFIA
jgi:hypothetical protein